MTVKFAQNWKFGVEYVRVPDPPATSALSEHFEFTLAYDDSWMGLPITLNPYVKLFYNASGSSTVVPARLTASYDVELASCPPEAAEVDRHTADRLGSHLGHVGPSD
jgi:hypothetical protein